MKNIYWKLQVVSCILVTRNNMWFNSAKHILCDLWKTIEYERINGYEHRAPKPRKNKTIKDISNNQLIPNKCYNFNITTEIIQ